ncbi:MAG: hypothetical protein HFJ44_07555 [Clostridia bacterium]|jgi:hypothetical protein|nr:hypothetical protein [Clostridia bacterium]
MEEEQENINIFIIIIKKAENLISAFLVVVNFGIYISLFSNIIIILCGFCLLD